MNKFIESIRCENRQLYNLSYHQDRVNKSFNHFFPESLPFQITDIQIPPDIGQGLFKCRVLYAKTILQIRFIPYKARQISSLKLVFDNNITYSFKLEHREPINALFQQRAKADDVLIIKNEYVTDTSYANIAFRDGQHWFTPSTPLLAGTMRQYLLDQEILVSRLIHYTDIWYFHSFKLFNAMMPFDQAPEISTQQVFLKKK